MRGHEPIIAMRRRGLKPRTVFLDAFEDLSKSWRLWPTVDPSAPQVEVLPTEPLSGLDLRFLVGLRVVITGHCRRRVEALRALCVEAQAARVLAVVCEPGSVDAVCLTSEVAA